MSSFCHKVHGMTTPTSAEITTRIAERLRSIAFDQRVTQGAIATAASISRSAANEYLNGRKQIPMSTFFDICAALDVDPAVLLGEVQRELKS